MVVIKYREIKGKEIEMLDTKLIITSDRKGKEVWLTVTTFNGRVRIVEEVL